MNIRGEFKAQIQLVSSKNGIWHWLVSIKEGRLTPKFKIISKKREGCFTMLQTTKGFFVYNDWQSELLYFNYDSDRLVTLRKIDDHLFAIHYGKGVYEKCKLYTEYGKFIRVLTNVGVLNNDLIAASKYGKWGFIDEDANDVIPFIYADVNSFNKYGYSIVDYDKEWAVDNSSKTVIDKTGKPLFEPIKCWSMYFASDDRIIININSKNGVIDLTGKQIIPPIYVKLVATCGFYKVKYNEKWGLFDKDGNMILEPIYDEIIETPEKFVVKDFARLEVTKNKEILKI